MPCGLLPLDERGTEPEKNIHLKRHFFLAFPLPVA